MTTSKKTKLRDFSVLFLAISASFLMTACGGGGESSDSDSDDGKKTVAAATTPTPAPAATPTPAPGPTPTPSSAGTIGKSLWANNCAACHGGDTGKGANPSKILNAIAANTGGMGYLSGTIGANEASQIATYVANPGAY